LRRKVSLHMVPGRGIGGYRRKDLLNKILYGSGFYRRKLRFRSRGERLDFLVKLFKPYTSQIDRYVKHAITSWLKNQGLREDEIKEFYSRLSESAEPSLLEKTPTP